MKRIVPLLVLVLALVVPVAAYADDPPAQPSTPAAKAGGHDGPGARLRQEKRRLRLLLRHCKRTHGAERQACLQRIIDRLEALKAKIDALEAKIQEKCPGVTPSVDPSQAPAPVAGDKCSRAPKLLAKLERIKAKIDKLEQRIRQFLSDDSSSSDAGTAPADGSSADADSIASLEAQLNAVAAQQG